MPEITIYTLSEGNFSLEALGPQCLNVVIPCQKTADFFRRGIASFGPVFPESTYVVIKQMLSVAPNPYEEKYPQGGYEVFPLEGDKLMVLCPDHGVFETSSDNFLYNRGCPMCKGVHDRAYPIGSRRTWRSNPVHFQGFGVGYPDSRVAKMVRGMLIHLREHPQIAREAMLHAHSFMICKKSAPRTERLSKKAVHIRTDGKVLGPDDLHGNSRTIAFYKSRVYADLIYHIATKISDPDSFLNLTGE